MIYLGGGRRAGIRIPSVALEAKVTVLGIEFRRWEQFVDE